MMSAKREDTGILIVLFWKNHDPRDFRTKYYSLSYSILLVRNEIYGPERFTAIDNGFIYIGSRIAMCITDYFNLNSDHNQFVIAVRNPIGLTEFAP